MANDQITQVPVEVLVQPDTQKAQVTQVAVEVLVNQYLVATAATRFRAFIVGE